MDVYHLTAHECRRLLTEGEASSEELTRLFLNRIAGADRQVQAFLHVAEEEALAQARVADAKSPEERRPWEGVPIALKDALCTKGMETTCGSRILKGYIPPYDGTVVRLLRDAGLVILGKLNMDEFAMGSSTENSAYQVTRNPWDLDRVPGGSSGGSAAAVAAAETPWSLGSDTGGSIRQPASLCGVVGMKPTYGAVSRWGLIAYASSLDQIGPLARTVQDAAALLSLIAVRDPLDQTSLGLPRPLRVPGIVQEGVSADALAGQERSASAVPTPAPDDPLSLKGIRFGYIKEYLGDICEPGVQRAFANNLETIESLGGTCVEVSLPSVKQAVAAYCIIAQAECSANLARFDGVRYGYRATDAADLLEMYTRTRGEGFGAEVKRRIVIGTYVLSSGHYDTHYTQAQRMRTVIIRDFQQAFSGVDLLMSPTSPTVAFRLGERMADPLAMYLSDLCTSPVNLAGLPGLSMPGGFADGLPVGLQIIGPHFSEQLMLDAAYAVEQALNVSVRPAPVAGGAVDGAAAADAEVTP
ncbi:MAG: Asp-tRNA(Asn)/Glu-tRNA(Gln) amidotransferase subunit GatA [Actinobacteria bacterium]|nr:Asp-tRNA(Asn)/Glu-tRNA(Gln) amidotransferase subunit GatA [Actinomycetota bacterium]